MKRVISLSVFLTFLFLSFHAYCADIPDSHLGDRISYIPLKGTGFIKIQGSHKSYYLNTSCLLGIEAKPHKVTLIVSTDTGEQKVIIDIPAEKFLDLCVQCK